MIPVILASTGAGAILGWLVMYLSTIRPRKHKKMPSLSKYMIFSIGFVVVYTVAEFIVSTITRVSHDVLTGCVYSFFGGEIVTCGLIKIFKLKEEGKNEDTNTGELSSRLDDLGGS